MNKHIHKIIFSKARGQLVVVQETAAAHGGSTATAGRGRSPAALIVAMRWTSLLLGLALGSCAWAQDVVADPGAAAGKRPIIDQAPNGLPVVNIATPNGSGVSHNQYQQFNVGSGGLILNNSATQTQTQLAGYIPGNANLASGSAKVILNEVTYANPSSLKGYVEVAGSKAQVVLANPWGISCSGCGFINTSQLIMTTGAPQWSAQGQLTGYRVNDGQVSIDGSGINASNLDGFAILARAARINAAIYAQKLDVITGRNEVAADLSTIQPLAAASASSAASSVAIDVAQLGGMYANAIRLVGTEQGVGVNQQGTVAAQGGDFTLTATGDIYLSGSTQALGKLAVATQGALSVDGITRGNQSVQLSSAGLTDIGGSVLAARDLDIQAESYRGNGTLVAGIQQDQMGTSGKLQLAAEQVESSGQWQAGDRIQLQASTANLQGATLQTQQGDISLSSLGDVVTRQATVTAGGNLQLQAAGLVDNQAGGLSAMQINVTAQGLDNRLGVIIQRGSTTNSQWQLTNTFDNRDGTLLTAGGQWLLQAGAIDNRGGQVAQLAGLMTLQAVTLDNTLGTLSSSEQLRATISNHLQNDGVMVAGQDISLQGGQIDNGAGIVQAGGQLKLSASDLSNASAGQILALGSQVSDLTVSGHVQNQGMLATNADLQLAANSLDNNSGELQVVGSLTINATGNVQNQSGTLLAGALQLSSAALDNRQGKLAQLGQGQATLQVSGTLHNQQGQIQGEQLAVQAQQLDNTDGVVAATHDLTVTSQQATNQQGLLQAGETLQLAVDSLDNHDGTVLALGQGTHILQGSQLQNDGGTFATSGSWALHSGQLDNGSGTLYALHDLQLQVSQLTDSGTIQAGERLGLTLATSGSQQSASRWQAGTSLSITAPGALSTSGQLTTPGELNYQGGSWLQLGKINAGGAWQVQADSLDNRGQIAAGNSLLTTRQLTNTGSLVTSALTVNADTLINQGSNAILATVGGMRLTVDQSLRNQEGAWLFSGQNLTIGNVGDWTNYVLNDLGKMESLGDLSIFAHTITNTATPIVVNTSEQIDSRIYDVSSSISHGHIACGRNDREHCETDIQTHTDISKNDIITTHVDNVLVEPIYAEMKSGGSVNFSVDLLDNAGRILAVGDVAVIGSVNNTGVDLFKTIRTETYLSEYKYLEYCYSYSQEYCYGKEVLKDGVSKIGDATTVTKVGSVGGIISAGATLSIAGPSIQNGSSTTPIASAVSPKSVATLAPPPAQEEVASANFTPSGNSNQLLNPLGEHYTVPSNGLFHLSTTPSQAYLVETDLAFTQYGNFISSDYMLQRLDYRSDQLPKRLGDGYYEQYLVSQAISQQTGKALLSGYESAQAQYQQLMSNGMQYAQQFGLTPGVALSAEQMASLTSDMVWLVKQELAGQDVLVPVVYMASGQAQSLKGQGAVLAGHNMELLADGQLINTGSIKADQQLLAQAADIHVSGGRVQAGGDLVLVASHDLKLDTQQTYAAFGSSVSGKNVTLLAVNDLTLQGSALQAEGNAQLLAGKQLSVISQQAVLTAANVQQQSHFGSQIRTGEQLVMEAGTDLMLQGATVKSTGDATLKTDGNLTIQSTLEQQHYSGWRGDTLQQQRQGSTLSSGGNVTLVADKDIQVLGSQVSSDHALNVQAGNNLIVASDVETQESHLNTASIASRYQRLSHEDKRSDGLNQAALTGKDSLVLQAGQHAVLTAAEVATAGNLVLAAGQDVQLNALGLQQQQDVYRGENYSKRSDLAQQVTQLQVTGGMTVVAGQDIRTQGAQLASDGSSMVAAGRDVVLGVAVNQHSDDSKEVRHSSGMFSSKTTIDIMHHDSTTLTGSQISAQQLQIQAGQDLIVTASNVSSSGDLTIRAQRDIDLQAQVRKDVTTSFHQEQRSGLSASLLTGVQFGSSQAQQSDKAKASLQTSSSLSGQNVTLVAGRDTTASAATILADQDLRVQADRDVNILAATNTLETEHQSSSSSWSMGLIPGASPRFTLYGDASASANGLQTSTTQSTSLLSANSGNLTVLAGVDNQYKGIGQGNLLSQGANLQAKQTETLQGNSVTLGAISNQDTNQFHQESRSFTIGAQLAGSVGSVMTAIYDNVQAARNTDNDRLQGALALKASYDAYKLASGGLTAGLKAEEAANALNAAKGETVNNSASAFGVSVTVGSNSSSQDSSSISNNQRGTIAQAQTLNINATDGNLSATGGKLQAADITLSASKDILLQAAANTAEVHNQNDSSNASAGATFGFGQQNGISFQLGFGQSQGVANGSETTYDNTLVTATNQLILHSGNDTTLQGAQLAAKTVRADVGGNLDITTLQDKSQYESHQSSSGINVSICVPPICYGQVAAGSVNLAQQDINHDYQSAVGQSGIAAGTGGFNINVTGNTGLTGAAITSQASTDKNTLQTGSLSYQDLDNHQNTEASSSSVGVSYNGANSLAQNLMGNAMNNLAANALGNVGLPANGSESSQTRSVISPAQVTITGGDVQSKVVADTLTQRDASTVNGALTNTLTLQQAQQLAQKMMDAQDTVKAAQIIGGIGRDITNTISQQKLAEADQLAKNGDQAGAVALRAQYGTGSDFQRAGQAISAAIQGLVGGDMKGALTDAAAPYLAQVVKQMTTDADGHTDLAANAMAHAALGALLAAAKGQNSTAGAVGGGLAPITADMLMTQLYPNTSKDQLNEEQRQTIAALTTLVGTLAGGLATSNSAGAVTGGLVANNEVLNNSLSKSAGADWVSKLRNLTPSQQEAMLAKYKFDSKVLTQQAKTCTTDCQTLVAQLRSNRDFFNTIANAFDKTDPVQASMYRQEVNAAQADLNIAFNRGQDLASGYSSRGYNTGASAAFTVQGIAPGQAYATYEQQNQKNFLVLTGTVALPIGGYTFLGPVVGDTIVISGGIAGGFDAAGQYAQACAKGNCSIGAINPVQSLFAANTAMVTGPMVGTVGSQLSSVFKVSGLAGNTISSSFFGGGVSYANTSFNNAYYGNHDNASISAWYGAAAGSIGTVFGANVLRWTGSTLSGNGANTIISNFPSFIPMPSMHD